MDEDRETDELEQQSERLGRHIDEAREDWERKKDDASVPGALPDAGEMDGDDRPETDYPAKG